MIGSTELSSHLTQSLNKLVEAWEDSMYANYDDFVYIDGEEGDYGIIKYFVGDELMMIKYVDGGDADTTVYTDRGVEFVQTLLMRNMQNEIQSALNAVRNPAEGIYGFRMGTNIIQDTGPT